MQWMIFLPTIGFVFCDIDCYEVLILHIHIDVLYSYVDYYMLFTGT